MGKASRRSPEERIAARQRRTAEGDRELAARHATVSPPPNFKRDLRRQLSRLTAELGKRKAAGEK